MADNFLFGSSTLPTVTTQDTSNTTYPSWYQSYLNSILGKASSVANAPYQQYGGPRIAPQTQDTLNSYNMVRDQVGSQQPLLNTAGNYLASAGQAVGQGDIDQYMNPYTNDVVNSIAQLGQRNLTENLLPQVNDTFIKSGNFGSSTNGDFTQRALRDTNESVLNQQTAALQSGFGNALTAAQNNKQNQLNAGEQLGSLANTGQTIGLKDAAALEGIGNEQQQQGQNSLDLAYNDFQNQTQYPEQQVNFLSNIAHGINAPTSTTSTSTGPGTASQQAPNPLSQVLGAGVGLSGILSQLGYRRGGEVTPAARAAGKPATITGIGMGAAKKSVNRAKASTKVRGIGQMRMAA